MVTGLVCCGMVQHLSAHEASMSWTVLITCKHVGHFVLVVVQKIQSALNSGWLIISSTKELKCPLGYNDT